MCKGPVQLKSPYISRLLRCINHEISSYFVHILFFSNKKLLFYHFLVRLLNDRKSRKVGWQNIESLGFYLFLWSFWVHLMIIKIQTKILINLVQFWIAIKKCLIKCSLIWNHFTPLWNIKVIPPVVSHKSWYRICLS